MAKVECSRGLCPVPEHPKGRADPVGGRLRPSGKLPVGEEHQPYYVFIKDITDTMIEMRKEKLINSNQFYANG